jgi:hypothetical protein
MINKRLTKTDYGYSEHMIIMALLFLSRELPFYSDVISGFLIRTRTLNDTAVVLPGINAAFGD